MTLDNGSETCPHRENPGTCAVCRKLALQEATRAYEALARRLGPAPAGEIPWEWSRAIISVGVALQCGSVADIDDVRRSLLSLKCALMIGNAEEARRCDDQLAAFAERIHERASRRRRPIVVPGTGVCLLCGCHRGHPVTNPESLCSFCRGEAGMVDQ